MKPLSFNLPLENTIRANSDQLHTIGLTLLFLDNFKKIIKFRPLFLPWDLTYILWDATSFRLRRTDRCPRNKATQERQKGGNRMSDVSNIPFKKVCFCYHCESSILICLLLLLILRTRGCHFSFILSPWTGTISSCCTLCWLGSDSWFYHTSNG